MKTARLSAVLTRPCLYKFVPGAASMALGSYPLTPKSLSRHSQRAFSSPSGLKDLLWVSEEVSDAVATNKPVVALESTIYTHGFMGKTLAQEHDQLVRSHGGIPAIIAIVDGVPKVGVSHEDIVTMIESGSAVKVSRRDISYLVGMGLAGRKIHGGTTIAGTMLLARLAGIRVFGTGGLGGVHRGGENSMDISADLTELGRTRVAVVSSGCKGFLDLPRTLEFLETQGCLVSTFADGRTGDVDFPAFWARDSGVTSPSTFYTDEEAAAMIFAQEKLNIESGMLIANPISEEYGIPKAEMQSMIEQAVTEALEKGFTGNKNTPFILGRLKELTGERAVVANMALVKSNIIRATKISVELSRMLTSGTSQKLHRNTPIISQGKVSQTNTANDSSLSSCKQADILVAGSVAIDLNCDYGSIKSGQVEPQRHTSNPARISQSIGGVGHNVALAAHYASSDSEVAFCSLVGDDVAGTSILSTLRSTGLDSTRVKVLTADEHPNTRTAQYVAVNDGKKDLVIAMADMDIFKDHPLPHHWQSMVAETKPKWLVTDGNWSPEQLRTWLQAGRENKSQVIFEPVSVEKSRGLFCRERGLHKLRIFPDPSVALASPNQYELAAMHQAAQENDYFESSEWFGIIDSFGMRGARDKFVHIAGQALTDAGVPLQSVQLLPYIPTVITKLGAQGVLMTSILSKDDARLRDRDEEEYILSRAPPTHPSVGGIYMRLFPAAKKVEEVISVNGVGDTFLGVLVAGLAQGGRVDRLINVAQKGAVLSLQWPGSVSPKVATLKQEVLQSTKA